MITTHLICQMSANDCTGIEFFETVASPADILRRASRVTPPTKESVTPAKESRRGGGGGGGGGYRDRASAKKDKK